MARLWFGNFDFETHLAGGGGPSSTSIRRLAAELAMVWCAVAREGDLVWSDAPVESDFLEELVRQGLPRLTVVSDPAEITESVELEPWGWCGGLPRHRSIRSRHPPHDAVKRVNAREYSFTLETEFDGGLDDAARIERLDELRAVVRPLDGTQRWVVKAQYSNAARERCPGCGNVLEEHVINWCRKRLQRDGLVFFEPWVERVAEVGLQFDVPREGKPRILGVVPLLTDAAGQYVGSRIEVEGAIEETFREEAWASAIDIGADVARHVQDAGYFGPLGIDAMRYCDDDGVERVRAIQDVNARWTMGRIALGFRRILRAGERAVWLHVRWNTPNPESWFRGVEELLPLGMRMIRTSPAELGGTPVEHGTVLFVSRNEADLAEVERLADPSRAQHPSTRQRPSGRRE